MQFGTRPRQPHGDPLNAPPTDPDPLDTSVAEAGTWGLPSTEGLSGQLAGQSPTMLRQPASPTGDRYSDGILVGAPVGEADAEAAWPPEHLLGALVETPRQWEAPHEATHRRYEAPLTVAINQAAAGFTLIGAPQKGLHYVKLIAACLTLDAAGTVRFVQGGDPVAGTGAADITGNIAAPTNGGFVLPPARLETPWLFTAPDLPFGLFTVTGKAQGFVVICFSPFDS